MICVNARLTKSEIIVQLYLDETPMGFSVQRYTWTMIVRTQQDWIYQSQHVIPRVISTLIIKPT